MQAQRALRLLSRNLLRACDNGADREAMLLGAMFAGQAFANAPVAAVHALAYPVGGIVHVPHGLSNALVLPHVLRFNVAEAADLYADLARVILPGANGNSRELADRLIHHLEHMIKATGVPRRLRDVGISAADLPRLAQDAMLQTRLLVNNPSPVTKADALAIYQAAY